MDTSVLIMVMCIYAGALLAPLSVLSAARRTGHGPGWQVTIALCALVIWAVLALAFAQEFLSLTFLSSVLERLAILAVIALAVVSVAGFWLSVKRWPRRS